jgi:hypothetical protein
LIKTPPFLFFRRRGFKSPYYRDLKDEMKYFGEMGNETVMK